jgi:pimeloyl-ACP methyl ester carboxylesterase
VAGLRLALLVLGAAATVRGSDEAAKATPTPPTPAATVVKPARIEDFAPPEEFVTAAAIKTHFVSKGEAGRPVVLVHGFGSSTFTWRKNVDTLAPRYRVYALDLKGFGLSARPKDGQYHMDAYTRHLLGFLDVMKLDRPVLVGHSLGGAVVARLALLHPERVGGLVLEDPVPLTLPHANAAELLKRAGVVLNENERKPGTFAAGAALINPAMANRVLPLFLRSTITPQTVETVLKAAYHDPGFVTPELVEAYYRPITIEGAAEAMASMMNPPPPDPAPLPGLGTLKLPALVAWGAHDPFVPEALLQDYVTSIPGARKAVFDRSGHVPHEEEAPAFNARLLEFLDALP